MVEKKVLSKVLMLGDINVRKTTLLNCFLGVTIPAKASLGQDFRKKELKIGNNMIAL